MKRLFSQKGIFSSLKKLCGSASLTRTVKNERIIDGNSAAVEAAYKMSDYCFVYPISPISEMANKAEKWRTKNKKNIFSNVPTVRQLQSEAGAIGAVHGCITNGGLATSFTASQGLLLMAPTLYQIAGQLHPFVLHIGARSLATSSTCILCDHADVMSIRPTGFTLLNSRTVQECYDLGLLSHLITLKSRVPVAHFFDGHQISDQFNLVEFLDDEKIETMIDFDAIEEHKARALNPTHPTRMGSSINSIYYQLQESSNKFFDNVPNIVKECFSEFEELSGRKYELFKYFGDENAKNIVVAMGGSTIDLENVVQNLNSHGEKVGCISVKLFHPWSVEDFLKCIPSSVEKIAVLDRTKEHGAIGEPIYMNVISSLFGQNKSDYHNVTVIRGRYGLGGAHTFPDDFKAVFDNLKLDNPKEHFILGIEDDLTNLTIRAEEPIKNGLYDDVISTVFYGSGADGTVSAAGKGVLLIGAKEGYFAMGDDQKTPHKAGSITTANLRYGKRDIPINVQHPIQNGAADYVICNNKTYLSKLPMIDKLKENGVFLLNIPFEDLDQEFMLSDMKEEMIKKNIQFYVINSDTLAQDFGLGRKINYISLTAYLKITGLFTDDEIRERLYPLIEEGLAEKGEKMIQKNKDAVEKSFNQMKQIPLDSIKTYDKLPIDPTVSDFIKLVQIPNSELRTQSVKVSEVLETGFTPTSTSKFEKRGIATKLPKWLPENCTQCGLCSFQCPHSVIRSFALKEIENLPDDFDYTTMKRKKNSEIAKYFTIQVSANDCTGCFECVTVCPAEALDKNSFTPENVEMYQTNFAFAQENNVNDELSNYIGNTNVSQFQFKQPLFEFNGACDGCAESAIIKVLTQIYGNRMIVANATGCSTVFSSYYYTSPWCTNDEMCGPAYGRSLFENAAEFGFGMSVTTQKRRTVFHEKIVEKLKGEELKFSDKNLIKELETWSTDNNWMDADKSYNHFINIRNLIDEESSSESVKFLKNNLDQIVRPMHWIIGGDGYAYDIGSAGIDHLLHSNENVNILILDNENYANTGGQSSKASPRGVFIKLASEGKRTKKKDLPLIAMQIDSVYVGTISIAYDPEHTLKVLKEAGEYDGPSIVIAYCPCTNHNNRGEDGLGVERLRTETLAVKSGYFPLYSYNPSLRDEGKNPFVLKTKKIDISLLDEFLLTERRFTNLQKDLPEIAVQLQTQLHENLITDVQNRFDKLQIIYDYYNK